MLRLRLRPVLTLLFAILFAAASLGHAPSMIAAPAPDCHGDAMAGAADHADASTDSADEVPAQHGAQHPAGMPIGCPLANLPPPPGAQAVAQARSVLRAAYMTAIAHWPPSADLDRIDPPPRLVS